MSRKVLIAVDGSEYSENAFETYCKLPESKSDTVFLHHAIDPPLTTSGLPFAGIPDPYAGSSYEEILEEFRQKSQVIENEFMTKCQSRNMKCQFSASVGNPEASLLSQVKSCNPDMIVMGTRGLSVMRRTIVGSVSRFMVNHSNKPIMIVPPPNSTQ